MACMLRQRLANITKDFPGRLKCHFFDVKVLFPVKDLKLVNPFAVGFAFF